MTEGAGPRRHTWLVWLCLGFGLYQLLTGTYRVPELLVWLGAVTTDAAVNVLARDTRKIRLGVSETIVRRLCPLVLRGGAASLEVLQRPGVVPCLVVVACLLLSPLASRLLARASGVNEFGRSSRVTHRMSTLPGSIN